MRLPFLRRLRWRLVLGFALIIAALLSLLTVAERIILQRSLETTLTASLQTTIHAGLGNLENGLIPPKLLDLGLPAVAKHLGLSPDQYAIVMKQADPQSRKLVAGLAQTLVQDESARLWTLTDALSVADQPAAVLDSGGRVWTGTATLAHDRERATPLHGIVLQELTHVAQKLAPGLREARSARVATADGPYLLVLEPTDIPVFTAARPLDAHVLDFLARFYKERLLLRTGAAPPRNPAAALQAGLQSTWLVVMMAHSLRETEGTIATVTIISIGGALIVLVLAAILSLLVVGGALRPLAVITAGAERLARGDYGHRLALRAGTDEVGRLATAFDEMAAAIGAAFATQRRFVADASHELRTPLTALRGYTDVLLMGVGDDPAEAERILRAMQEDLGRMSRLVNDLLTLARLDGGASLQIGPVALGDLLGAAAGEGMAISREDHSIVVDASAGDLVVWGDRDRLRQVFSNVVGNACAYSPPGTAIHLRAEREGRWAVLTVQDNGPGITPADLARLGERFYRGDTARSRQTGGAGLGLAIARGIVEAHGGTLAISSALGRGTLVTMRLPLASA